MEQVNHLNIVETEERVGLLRLSGATYAKTEVRLCSGVARLGNAAPLETEKLIGKR